MRTILLGIAVWLSALAGHAATLTDTYSGYFVIGDSLSDNGNLFARTGQPPAPYYEGRFSNGPVFSDFLANGFVEGVTTRNYAFGGARAIDRTPAGPIDDLGTQVTRFLGDAASGLGHRPLVSVWMGANDILQAFGAGGDPFGTAVAAANNVASAVGQITSDPVAGVRDIVVMTLPDFGQIPQFAELPKLDPTLSDADRAQLKAAATGATDLFNGTLLGALDAAVSDDVNLTVVDVGTLFSGIIENPSSIGQVDVTGACINPVSGYCGPAAAETTLFFDSVHPNTAAHQELARVISEEVTPVPLPAGLPLLIGGLGALWGVGRLRTARAQA
ncbi:MAG: SGNH/GDSL hydrolase family protein [Pseudomonadota bacterium]